MNPDRQLRGDEVVRRARRAEALLNDSLLQEAFDRAEKTFTREMVRADTPERREAEAAKVAALEEVKRVLRTFIGRGEYLMSR